MSFGDLQRPEDVRAMMHMGYEEYARGEVLRPRVRLAASPEAYPRKSQAIATALAGAWRRIDEDEAFFQDATAHQIQVALEDLQGDHVFDPGARLVLTQVGRNAVNMAIIAAEDGRPKLTFGQFPRQEFVEELNGLEINLTDGRCIKLVDGQMLGDFDAAIARQSNVAGVMMSGAGSPVS